MLGFSVYLNEEKAVLKRKIVQMKEHAFTLIFSSINLPEYEPSEVVDKLRFLLDLVDKYQLQLILDVNQKSFTTYQIENVLAEANIEHLLYLRLDDGFTSEEIVQLSKTYAIVLNASTLTPAMLASYEASGLELSKLLACHNYYPREDTGLDESYFLQMNQHLRAKNIREIGFFGNEATSYARGPIYAGLPTLEIHRHCHPLVACVELLEKYACDFAILADLGLSNQVLQQFDAYYHQKKLVFRLTDVQVAYLDELKCTHQSRNDISKNVIRCQESRRRNQGSVIPPLNCQARTIGSVTIDNKQYLRYQGELQITKVSLPADQRVNKIAQVISADLDLLSLMQPGMSFGFMFS